MDDLWYVGVGVAIIESICDGESVGNGFSTGWMIDGTVPLFLTVFVLAVPLFLNGKLATCLVGGVTTLTASAVFCLVNSLSSFRLIINRKWSSPPDTKCFNVLCVRTAHFSDSIIS